MFRETISTSGHWKEFLHNAKFVSWRLHLFPRFAADSNEERDQWVRAIKDSIVENPFGGIVPNKRASLRNIKREAIPLSASTQTLTSRSRTSTATFYDNETTTTPNKQRVSFVSYTSTVDDDAVTLCLDGTKVDTYEGYSEYLDNKHT